MKTLSPAWPSSTRAGTSARGLARIGDDHVEGEVRERTLRVAHAALDAAPQRTLLLVDHGDHGRDAAGDRGARAVLEVVEGRKRRRGRQVRVQVDASGKHEL